MLATISDELSVSAGSYDKLSHERCLRPWLIGTGPNNGGREINARFNSVFEGKLSKKDCKSKTPTT